MRYRKVLSIESLTCMSLKPKLLNNLNNNYINIILSNLVKKKNACRTLQYKYINHVMASFSIEKNLLIKTSRNNYNLHLTLLKNKIRIYCRQNTLIYLSIAFGFIIVTLY